MTNYGEASNEGQLIRLHLEQHECFDLNSVQMVFIRALEGHGEIETHQVTEAMARLKEKEKELKAAKTELELRQNVFESLGSQLATMKDENEDLKKRVSTQHKEILELTVHCAVCGTLGGKEPHQVTVARSRFEQKDKEIASLCTKLETTTEANETLQKKVSSQQKEISKLTERCEELEAKLSEAPSRKRKASEGGQ